MVLLSTVQAPVLFPSPLWRTSGPRSPPGLIPGGNVKTFVLYLLAASLAIASQTFSIDSPERGKRYQVTTTARGIALTMNQRWLYQPAVVKTTTAPAAPDDGLETLIAKLSAKQRSALIAFIKAL